METVDTIEVPSRMEWVNTRIRVQSGERLRFNANGTWFDAVIPCSADGYPASCFYALKLRPRIPDGGRYFRLMGRIVTSGVEPVLDDPAETFPIGARSERQATSSGVLFVFANDRIGYYWNNWGMVTLTVSR
ncbi:hypothetical protein [Burkholderia stagnalis]|uniref:hypothetical protein n=1 Tax=Burkholderia stagnalis TaxID=1503054 RepID=UPI0012DAB001|nr:hypothetical protein [Burkholderia stagnalis]